MKNSNTLKRLELAIYAVFNTVRSVKKCCLTRCFYVLRFCDAFREFGRLFHIVGAK